MSNDATPPLKHQQNLNLADSARKPPQGTSSTNPVTSNNAAQGGDDDAVASVILQTIAMSSSRGYLCQTIVPILTSGLTALAKARPSSPIRFLADFLIANKNTYLKKEISPAPFHGSATTTQSIGEKRAAPGSSPEQGGPPEVAPHVTTEGAANPAAGVALVEQNSSTLSTRAYLETFIAPVLHFGLAIMGQERPADPIDFLVKYLNENINLYEPNKAPSAGAASLAGLASGQ